jgi:hypothetical protein
VRDKFGESSIGLATGMKGRFRERTHENPVGLPGKDLPGKDLPRRNLPGKGPPEKETQKTDIKE